MDEIKFPVIVYQQDKGPIMYSENKTELTSFSRGGEKKFNKFYLIDSRGKMYYIDKVFVVGKAPFIMSLKWLQPMNKVDFDMSFIEQKELADVKNTLINHIKKHQRYWSSLNDFDTIKSEIMSIPSFIKLYLFFR